MRYKNTDAIVIKEDGSLERKVSGLVELIKGKIYCPLRQRFDADEVKEIYEKIDDAVKCFVGDME